MALTVTAAELDAMDVGQIVVDHYGAEWKCLDRGDWDNPAFSEQTTATLVADFGPIRRRESHVEQPMPTASTGPSMHDLAVREVLYRKATGEDRYGQTLQAMNGRDAVRDTIEELADGLAYALQIREERRLLRAELERFRGLFFGPNDTMGGPTLDDIITHYFPEEN